MRTFVFILLLLVVAIVLGVYRTEDIGTAVFTYGETVVRLKLADAAIALILGFVVFYILVTLLSGMLRSGKIWRGWRKKKNNQHAQNFAAQGYANLITGQWTDAERNLMKKVEHHNAPLMNYIGAAYAAQQNDDFAKRDEYLKLAAEKHPAQRLAVDLTAARLHCAAGDHAEARVVLEASRQAIPNSPPTLRLLCDVYQQLGDWPALVKVLPQVEKMKLFPEEEFARREKVAMEHHLNAPALLQGEDEKIGTKTFKALPRAKKKSSNAVIAHTKHLLQAEDATAAERFLRKALYANWSEDMIELYGKVGGASADDQLKIAEKWLTKHPESNGLMMTLGRLNQRTGNQEEAVEWFNKAIASGREDGRVALASMMVDAGEKEAAIAQYQQLLGKGDDVSKDPVVNEGQLLLSDEKPIENAIIPVVNPS